MIEIPLAKWLFPGEMAIRKMLWSWAADGIPVHITVTDYGWKARARVA